MKLKNLKTKFLGKDYYYYKEIDSTQKEVWRRVNSENIKNGTLIRAENQSSGEGTHGRIWYTEKNNIAFSFYVKMNCDLKKLNSITYEIAGVIVNIFKDLYNISLEIKLPNDIFYNNKKIAGILTQTKCIGEVVRDLVIGIGINTFQKDFNSEIKDVATSIKNEFQIDIDSEDFISEFCNRFENKLLERIGI